jgi:hypothetical protein
MRKTSFYCSTLLFTLFASQPVFALDASGARYTQMFATEGPGTITRAAQDIYNTGTRDQEVLDVAAQTLANIYQKAPNARDYVDATAWLCKALGNSGNGRYKQLIKDVSESDIHRNAKKHCKKAQESLPDGVAPFKVGSVDVSKYRQATATSTPAPAKKAAPANTDGKKVDLSVIKEGMSLEEVTDLLGPPTSQTTYSTGKAWVPFNYGKKDLQRIKYLYKGHGQVVFSLQSAYNGVYRVIEIVVDPNESGYP